MSDFCLQRAALVYAKGCARERNIEKVLMQHRDIHRNFVSVVWAIWCWVASNEWWIPQAALKYFYPQYTGSQCRKGCLAGNLTKTAVLVTCPVSPMPSAFYAIRMIIITGIWKPGDDISLLLLPSRQVIHLRGSPRLNFRQHIEYVGYPSNRFRSKTRYLLHWPGDGLLRAQYARVCTRDYQ